MQWGLLNPEELPSAHRRRTLELTGVIRNYNELAVPGLGRLWFIKQIAIATLGVRVAHETRSTGHTPIEVTNAIEALACFGALRKSGWQSDPRLSGRRKLYGRNDLSFRALKKRTAYVSQPMRMAVTEPLVALGFVQASGTRFNAFTPAELGDELINAVFGHYRPYKRCIVSHLVKWVQEYSTDEEVRTDSLINALAPNVPIEADEARRLMRERLERDSERRRAALRWVESLSDGDIVAWDDKPDIIGEDHWNDMVAGAAFTQARDKGIACLEEIETYLHQYTGALELDLLAPLPEQIRDKAEAWRAACEHYQTLPARGRGGQEALKFCSESCEGNLADAIGQLVNRDNDTLRRDGNRLVATAAFRARFNDALAEDQSEENTLQGEAGEGASDSIGIKWPEGASSRLEQLHYLIHDLAGELDDRLGK